MESPKTPPPTVRSPYRTPPEAPRHHGPPESPLYEFSSTLSHTVNSPSRAAPPRATGLPGLTGPPVSLSTPPPRVYSPSRTAPRAPGPRGSSGYPGSPVSSPFDMKLLRAQGPMLWDDYVSYFPRMPVDPGVHVDPNCKKSLLHDFDGVDDTSLSALMRNHDVGLGLSTDHDHCPRLVPLMRSYGVGWNCDIDYDPVIMFPLPLVQNQPVDSSSVSS